MKKHFKQLKSKKYYKPVKYALLVVGFVLFLDKCTYMVMPPWKITDPNQPGFKAENFKYEDYLYGEDQFSENLKPVLVKLFPLGTPKSFVDNVLVKKHGAELVYSKPRDLYVYRYRAHKTPLTPMEYFQPLVAIGFIFDENERLNNIKIYNDYLYGEER